MATWVKKENIIKEEDSNIIEFNSDCKLVE